VNITPQIAHVKAGKLRPLALGASKRSSIFPEVPTVAELGFPGFVSESWNGLAAPHGTPAWIVDRLYKAMEKVMNSNRAQEVLASLGAESTVLGPVAFTTYVARDEKQLTPLIKALSLNNF
jgi:tripartite-type tricarboxylate transporter receptor subunit TctC